MALPELSLFQNSSMANNNKYSTVRHKASSFLADGFLFVAGAMAALLVVWAFWSFVNPTAPTPTTFSTTSDFEQKCAAAGAPQQGFNVRHDPPDPNFYDDPYLSYSIDKPLKGWDQKRRNWLKSHPSYAGAPERVLLVSGSQPNACQNPIGDHLLLRFFKNKVDYCRIHGCSVFYNNVLLHPKMFTFWAKIPVIRSAMVAHPEAEWIWWVDSDAAFTDMDFRLPLDRYKDHNLVVHGWEDAIYEKKSWVGLNAGVFLIRNCQWALDFMEVWAQMGPQSPDYEKWGQTLRSTFKDKLFPESDDQSGLVYLLLHDKGKWGNKIYIEGEYYFEGYWLEIVGTLDKINDKYMEVERGVRRLRRRHAEVVGEGYSELWEEYLRDAGNGKGSWRRPFVTHFTGCQPCSGDHNSEYSRETCWEGMQKVLTFADNQVLRRYGYVHPGLLNYSSVSPLPFDFPA